MYHTCTSSSATITSLAKWWMPLTTFCMPSPNNYWRHNPKVPEISGKPAKHIHAMFNVIMCRFLGNPFGIINSPFWRLRMGPRSAHGTAHCHSSQAHSWVRTSFLRCTGSMIEFFCETHDRPMTDPWPWHLLGAIIGFGKGISKRAGKPLQYEGWLVIEFLLMKWVNNDTNGDIAVN